MTDKWDTVVVGGGVAGISAAVHLADAGARVLLVERSAYLGGRASSFLDRQFGTLVDVSPHITLGCCTAFQELLERIEVQDKVQYLDTLEFSLPNGTRAGFRASCLPVPYHLLPALLKFPQLGLLEKASVARLMLAAIRWAGETEHADNRAEELSFADVCKRERVSPRAMQMLIEPTVISACNATMDAVDASYGLMVLWEVLCRDRFGYRLGIPRVPLASLFTDPTVSRLEERGSSVMLRNAASAINVPRDGSVEVITRSGQSLRAASCVVAVPVEALRDVHVPDMVSERYERTWSALRYGSIVAVHLWFDRPVDCPKALCLIGARPHWVFNRTGATRADSTGAAYLTTVTSADPSLTSMSPEAIRNAVIEDLSQRLPDVRSAKAIHWRVVRYRRATFVPYPGFDRFRPPQVTPLPNIALAGDWTATGWPSTMEGAVRSGRLASQAILHHLA